jgi:hypothetical protein
VKYIIYKLILQALQTVYPNHPWDPLKLKNIPRGYWTNSSNQLAFMDQLARKLNIEKASDWYRISCDEVVSNGGRSLLGYHQYSLIKGTDFMKVI